MFENGFDDRHRRMVPPQNLEAESSVIGAVFIDADCLNDILGILKAEDFYRESHQKIFLAMVELFERQVPIDVTQ